jgi:HSP20 family protein
MMALRFSPLANLRDEMDRMRNEVEHFFGSARGSRPGLDPAGYPALNAWEDTESFYVEAELPGLALEDLEIALTESDTLTIKGERKEPAHEGGAWHRRERAFGTFERTLKLPGAVDAERVEASLKLGVLTIKLSKAPELKPRKIEVKAL